MQVIEAETAGFCSGVKKAVECLLEAVNKYGKGYTFGPIVHNEEVAGYLESKGVSAVERLEDAGNTFLAIRTHGITPEMTERIDKKSDLHILDLTCPRVKRVQKIAAGLKKEGTNVIIFGNRSHPEVEGLIGWSGGCAEVVSSPADMENLKIEKPSALIAQTTGNPGLYEKVSELFLNKYPSGKVFNTICPETGLRQEAAIKLAQRVEALVVVGSNSSANTKALFECCRQLKPTCRVANCGELNPSYLRKFNVIGVTAGASTPPWTIKEVVERMENESVENEKVESVEEVSSEEETVKEEVKEEELKEEETLVTEEKSRDEDNSDSEEEEEVNEEPFEFSGDVTVAQVGEQVTGKIARVTDEEVYVDIGSKTEAILPLNEVHLGEGESLADHFTPEDDIEVTVLDIDEQDGKVVVSHKRLARDKRLKELEQALEDGVTLEGKVKTVVSAGIVIDLGSGIEGFMPGSLVDTKYIPDFSEFKDQKLNFKILEYDREKNKLILNRRKVMEEINAKEKEKTLQSLEVDSVIKGTVKRLTDFGAFVDVGGIDGLVHISELSWERVKHPKEVLKVGEEVEVKVLEVIPEKDRISLSIRKTQSDPWNKAVEELESDQLIKGKVTRLVNFGAFIEIKPGVEGLAHISQLADYHVKHPSEILSEGEEVEVKIIEVKPKAKRISLSLKEASGVAVAPASGSESDAENGNVTLGDLFGDLFDKEDYSPDSVDDAVAEDDSEATDDSPEESDKG